MSILTNFDARALDDIITKREINSYFIEILLCAENKFICLLLRILKMVKTAPSEVVFIAYKQVIIMKRYC